ncbi:RNA recognition motif 2-domain-containing protein, partial [Cunninghamella echinulata]
INGSDKRTTFMIRNIPNKYTLDMLRDFLDATNKGTYDFLYLRFDFTNKCNAGYAFINFIKPTSVVPFIKERVGKIWNKFNSEKLCDISYAKIQGKRSLIAKFRNSNVMAQDISFRPIIFYSSGSHQGEEE